VQTDPEPMPPQQQPGPPRSYAADASSLAAGAEAGWRLPGSEYTTASEGVPAAASLGAAARPHPPSPASVTGGPQPGGAMRRPAVRAPIAARTPPTPLPSPLTDADMGDLRLGDGDNELDAWGEEEVDRELARMKRELGIEVRAA
jgi:hypothetical protein